MMNPVIIPFVNVKGVVGNGSAMRNLRQGTDVWSRRQSLKARRQSAFHAEHHKAFDRLSGTQAKTQNLRQLPADSEQDGSLAHLGSRAVLPSVQSGQFGFNPQSPIQSAEPASHHRDAGSFSTGTLTQFLDRSFHANGISKYGRAGHEHACPRADRTTGCLWMNPTIHFEFN